MWSPSIKHIAFNNEIKTMLEMTPEALLNDIRPATARHNINSAIPQFSLTPVQNPHRMQALKTVRTNYNITNFFSSNRPYCLQNSSKKAIRITNFRKAVTHHFNKVDMKLDLNIRNCASSINGK